MLCRILEKSGIDNERQIVRPIRRAVIAVICAAAFLSIGAAGVLATGIKPLDFMHGILPGNDQETRGLYQNIASTVTPAPTNTTTPTPVGLVIAPSRPQTPITQTSMEGTSCARYHFKIYPLI
jgi:hypothetical protein